MKRFFLLFAALLPFFAASCSLYTPDPSLSRASTSEIRGYYDRAVFKTGDFSFQTGNFLRSNLYDEQLKKNPGKLILTLDEAYRKTGDPGLLTILADICCNVGQSSSDEAESIPFFLSCAYYVYSGLFGDVRDELNGKQLPSKFNPINCQMLSLYNISLARIFRFIQKRKMLGNDSYELQTATGYRIRFEKIQSELPFPFAAYAKFQPCAIFTVNHLSLLNQHFGIGIPLIATIRRNQPYRSLKLSGDFPMPATAVLHFDLSPSGEGTTARFQLFDPFITEKIRIGKEIVPLSLDYTTPVAAFTSAISEHDNIVSYMLNPILGEETGGIYMLEPYDPNKIPVVFIHGLMSAPTTWISMINVLRLYPFIRKNYQFWFCKYSSGNPIMVTAREMMERLNAAQKEFAHSPEAERSFSQMVLVGHSMGGLIARVMLQDDPYFFIETFCGMKWAELSAKLSPEERGFMQNGIFRRPAYVKRLVMMAVPHRGSRMAKWSLARMCSRMVKLPITIIDQTTTVLKAVARVTGVWKGKDWAEIATTGIDNLDPDHRFIRLVSVSPFAGGIPIHSIIGNKDAAGIPGGTDGVVSYESSHIDGVESELIVHSGHSVQQNPEAIRELARILHIHLKTAEKNGFVCAYEDEKTLKSAPDRRGMTVPSSAGKSAGTAK